jgi:SpoIIAA-like
LRHPVSWERIAVVTDVEHYRTLIKGFGWLIPGEVRLFANDEAGTAKAWVGEA